MAEYGEALIDEFRLVYRGLKSTRHQLDSFDLDADMADADLVIVHAVPLLLGHATGTSFLTPTGRPRCFKV